MINELSAKKYCKNFTEIENYEIAYKDAEQWICHHKLENIFTHKQLKEMGLYYNLKPGELMFIKQSNHNGNPKLHIGCKIQYQSYIGKGHKQTDETKTKISNSLKGIKRGKPTSEHKRKLAEAHKGRHWYNNGIISVMVYDCPEGFTKGRL